MRLAIFRPSRLSLLLLGLLIVLLLLLAVALHRANPPEIDTEFEGATIHLSADKAWSLIPGDCMEIRWQVEGIESIYVDGQGVIGSGEITYCPNLSAASPEFEITAQNGAIRTFTLKLHFLPTQLLISLLFVLDPRFCLCVAGFFFLTLPVGQSRYP